MRIPRIVVETLLIVAGMSLCACTGVLGVVHGDPGREPDASGRTSTAATTPAPAPLPAVSPSGMPADSGAPPVMRGAVSAVIVTFNDHAQQLAASDPRLTPEAIALAVEAELRAHQLFAPAASDVHQTLAITVEDFTSALASNATVLGYTFRNLVLIGSVQVQPDPAGARPPFTVHARTRVSNRESSDSTGSLTALFRSFALLTVADLRGVEAPAESAPR